MMLRTGFVRVGLLVALWSASSAHAHSWIGAWGAAPLPPTSSAPSPTEPNSFSNQTVRQIVRVSVAGDRVRVRLTNEYGTKPLEIGAARIAVVGSDGALEQAASRAVLFAGKPSVSIPAGAPLLSDPIDLPVKALSRLAISLYLPEDTGPCTCHKTGLETGFVSEPGDFTANDFTAKSTITIRAFISGVDVQTARPAKAIVTLGDSITDGYASTSGADRRWPDALAERLNARNGKTVWSVVNMGIGGNRVLAEGPVGGGQSALTRFDRDVLSVSGVAYVIVLEGINDLGFSYQADRSEWADFITKSRPKHKVTAESLIQGYRQLIERAHARGIKIIGATLLPYEGAGYYMAEGETHRQAVNQWIRTSGEFDAVIDFEAAVRDPKHPTRIADGLSGDHLHGNDAGYRAMANAVDLALFK